MHSIAKKAAMLQAPVVIDPSSRAKPVAFRKRLANRARRQRKNLKRRLNRNSRAEHDGYCVASKECLCIVILAVALLAAAALCTNLASFSHGHAKGEVIVGVAASNFTEA